MAEIRDATEQLCQGALDMGKLAVKNHNTTWGWKDPDSLFYLPLLLAATDTLNNFR